ncbi:MAG: NTP transferase domain-containing protein [Clostridiales Family XIII bacterium]|nr:NTP transferase domain-containing protein [Clostridiales Family XIII bacterium]
MTVGIMGGKVNLDNYIIPESMPIIDAMAVINDNAKGIAVVCDGMVLRGVVTDGNIRRYILGKGDLRASIAAVTNYEAKYINHHDGIDPIAYMRANHIDALPIVNSRNEVISIAFTSEEKVYKSTKLDVPVVIMAGGKGTRLLPFTSVLPKPLIPVGDKTITELIIEKFSTFGCDHFEMIVNYKKNLIRTFFEELPLECTVSFTEEEEYLGTGGGLKLLEGRYDDAFFMTNCDILVEEDYSEVLRHHREKGNVVTVVCALRRSVIPYGTVEVSREGAIERINEKPSFTHLVNTGFYVIEPDFLRHIPAGTFIHITDAIEHCVAAGGRVGAYPISDSAWHDMGEPAAMERMARHLETARQPDPGQSIE